MIAFINNASLSFTALYLNTFFSFPFISLLTNIVEKVCYNLNYLFFFLRNDACIYHVPNILYTYIHI